ncbi:hypothetical protein BKA61DRAFT_704943 [Leptodontidium sp. MPI-SDFR-AT-0119]|nr:hypothetical protein BKA61DRAFT_704943 [Leptodontidium sp. MPI-SDFR-AT-0119]
MEILHHGQRPSLALPEIYVYVSNPSDRFRTWSRSNPQNSTFPTTSSRPISTLNARDPVPPPLPPPRHLTDTVDGGNNGPDITWQWGNSHGRDSGRSISSVVLASSSYRSLTSPKSMSNEQPNFARRGSSTLTSKSMSDGDAREQVYLGIDEGYASLCGTSIGSKKSKYQDPSGPRTGFQSSIHAKFRTNTRAYDNSLLQKLDACWGSENTPPPRGHSKSAFTSSMSDASPTSRIILQHRQPNQLKPLSLSINTSRPGLARCADTPLSSDISPGNLCSGFGLQRQFEYRSPSDMAESDRSSPPHVPDHNVDFQIEEPLPRQLRIDDYSARPDVYSRGSMAGQKSRASSPPRQDGPFLHPAGSASYLFRWGESGSRSSPCSSSHSISGFVSSTNLRSNPCATTPSLAGSRIIIMDLHGRFSPGGISPGATDTGCDSTSVTYQHHTLSKPRPLVISRKLSSSIGHAKDNSALKIQGGFIRECCPKKRKRFDSQEERNSHEQEKCYECGYCRSRFKNKNEMNRHQNSVHLRRHSWSCAAISSYAAAFHASPTLPNSADTCGYCGEDFLRSGISSPSSSGPQIAIATEQDWEVRIGHLQEMHKFGECNHAKKFFRADHFKQHLIHSHAGCGNWISMLENMCRRDETLPEPFRGLKWLVRDGAGPGWG